MEGKSKHGPNKLRSYQAIHATVMDQFVRGGFVLSDVLAFRDMGDSVILIEGSIECLGNIVIQVRKLLRITNASAGADALVRTTDYRYHVYVRGSGNVFRYDSPHAHRPLHHVHRYDYFNSDGDGAVSAVEPEDAIPTLGEVIAEAQQWYWQNLDRIEGQPSSPTSDD